LSKASGRKKITLLLVVGLVIFIAGVGTSLYASIRYNDAKNQLTSIAEETADKYPYWNFDSRYEYARTQNPTLVNQMSEAENLMSLGVIIIGGGVVIVVVAIILFVVQRLLIKTIDNRIGEAIQTEQKTNI
jgi:CHASE3 domain sensor protein